MEDTVLDIALGDSGSDLNDSDASTSCKTKKTKPSVWVESFKEPIKLQGKFKSDQTKFTSSAKARVTFTIYLPDSSIPLRVRGVEFIIVNDKMDEILLGRPFLNIIGSDLSEHLQRIHPLIQNKHEDEIDSNKINLAITKYKGLSYRDTDDDPIKLPECLAAGIRIQLMQSTVILRNVSLKQQVAAYPKKGSRLLRISSYSTETYFISN